MKFTIELSKWRSGRFSMTQTGSGLTKLLNHEGYMCCLGFCALQIGYSIEDIKNKDMPSDILQEDLVPNPLVVECYNLFHSSGNSELSKEAMFINDSELPIETKMKELTKLFNECGHELEFVE